MDLYPVFLIVLCLSLGVLETRPTKSQRVGNILDTDDTFQSGDYIKPLKWLKQFHYFNGEVSGSISEESAHDLIKEPLKKFKTFYGINDGSDDLSEAALKAMEEPRCSKPDDEGGNNGNGTNSRRHKRFTLLNEGKYLWNDPRTPYPIKIGFKNYWNGKLTQAQQRAAAMTCANRWSEHANIMFKLAGENEVANIEIEFQYMDGPFNTIGTGLSPVPFRNPPTSYLRLDSGEEWALGQLERGEVQLLAGLCHEMGHTLSLSHSHEKSAIMYPSINSENREGLLHQDDIDGIVDLYGEKESMRPIQPARRTSRPPSPPRNTTPDNQVRLTTPTTTEMPSPNPSSRRRFRPQTRPTNRVRPASPTTSRPPANPNSNRGPDRESRPWWENIWRRNSGRDRFNNNPHRQPQDHREYHNSRDHQHWN